METKIKNIRYHWSKKYWYGGVRCADWFGLGYEDGVPYKYWNANMGSMKHSMKQEITQEEWDRCFAVWTAKEQEGFTLKVMEGK